MRRILAVSATVGVALVSLGTAISAAEAPARREWQVDGVRREALVIVPGNATKSPTPVVFAFHGHGGTMQHAARTFAYQRHWAEAIVVYPQGLNTPGALTDPEGKRSGWQRAAGDQNDRDLEFFDAVWVSLRKDYRVDASRVYATGHSNGGAFTYLLWSARGEVFAAVAPSGAFLRSSMSLAAKPMLHVAGRNDPLVRFAWQERCVETLRKVNGCVEGKPWGERCTQYPSPGGTPVVTYFHPGGHEFPTDAPKRIVEFFQQHAKATKPAAANDNAIKTEN